mmetsp:Transcript_5978/g.17992  ORF Transcript_5978/g.17992 Transcript_5978/m.17992 type:complete len:209 (+) Transcript_5978:1301-1927(+)
MGRPSRSSTSSSRPAPLALGVIVPTGSVPPPRTPTHTARPSPERAYTARCWRSASSGSSELASAPSLAPSGAGDKAASDVGVPLCLGARAPSGAGARRSAAMPCCPNVDLNSTLPLLRSVTTKMLASSPVATTPAAPATAAQRTAWRCAWSEAINWKPGMVVMSSSSIAGPFCGTPPSLPSRSPPSAKGRVPFCSPMRARLKMRASSL